MTGAIHIPQRPRDDVHVPFIHAALAFTILVGLSLAVVLPVQAAVGQMSVSWVVHAQVHGHAQVIGFAGLFVIGVAARLAPRFASRPLAYPRLLPWVLRLLVAGVTLRLLGQPLAEMTPGSAMLAAGALLEVAGALLAFVILTATLRPETAPAPAVWMLWASAVWLLLQALVGAWWLTDLALDGRRVLPSDRNAVLLTMQVFGFLLSAIAGVGMRSFPNFFGARPLRGGTGWAMLACLQGGTALWLLAGWADAYAWAGLGRVAVGAGIGILIASTGWWRREHRLAAASNHLVWALRPVLGSLTLTALLLILGGGRMAFEGASPGAGADDAVRHVFLVGVVMLGIVAMAQLILPEFASERFVHPPGAWRGPFFGGMLAAAVVLRGLLPWGGLESPWRFWAMGVGGLLATVAVLVFTVAFFRARRAHLAYLERLASRRLDSSIPLRQL